MKSPPSTSMSLQAVSKHLKVLENAGLIVKRKTGRIRRCRANFEALEQASRLIGQYRLVLGTSVGSVAIVHNSSKRRRKGTMGEKKETTVVVTEGVRS